MALCIAMIPNVQAIGANEVAYKTHLVDNIGAYGVGQIYDWGGPGSYWTGFGCVEENINGMYNVAEVGMARKWVNLQYHWYFYANFMKQGTWDIPPFHSSYWEEEFTNDGGYHTFMVERDGNYWNIWIDDHCKTSYNFGFTWTGDYCQSTLETGSLNWADFSTWARGRQINSWYNLLYKDAASNWVNWDNCYFYHTDYWWAGFM